MQFLFGKKPLFLLSIISFHEYKLGAQHKRKLNRSNSYFILQDSFLFLLVGTWFIFLQHYILRFRFPIFILLKDWTILDFSEVISPVDNYLIVLINIIRPATYLRKEQKHLSIHLMFWSASHQDGWKSLHLFFTQ